MLLRLFVVALTVAAAIGLLGLGSSGTASAHEHRAVGNYEFTVGWLTEPALANEPNALSLRVVFFENGVPEEGEEEEGEHAEEEGVAVEGLEETLTAEIIVGGGAQTRELPLEPAFRDPGHYEGIVIPTLPGEYSFHITGEIEGLAIDETFESGPETFSSVDDPADLEFPPQDDGGGTGPSSEDAGEEDDDDGGAALIVAILAGILAVAAAGIGLYAINRSRAG